MKTISLKLLAYGFIAPLVILIIIILCMVMVISMIQLLSISFSLSALLSQLKGVVMGIFGVLILSSIQAILYSIIMNFWILPRCFSAKKVMMWSGLLGIIAANLPILLLIISFSTIHDLTHLIEILKIIIIFAIIGWIVGIFSGKFLWRKYNF